jgi:uncharacterized cupredoxin-like copper-binding protein
VKSPLIAAAIVASFLGGNAVAQQPPHAHSHGEAAGKPGDPKRISRTVEVAMNDEMRFVPASIVVKQGETIRFVVRNVGQMPHEMVIGTKEELRRHAEVMQQSPDMAHNDPNGVDVEPGKRGQIVWQFTRAGRFDFACLRPGHFEAGMVGTINVERRPASGGGNAAPHRH